MAVFRTDIKVRFAHTDPAGILFYPRYFEMLNQVMEDWFEQELGYGYRSMVMEDRNGVPAVRVEADFRSPSELGDVINFSLMVEHLGRSACRVRVVGAVDGKERLTARLTVAFSDMAKRKARSWPEALKQRIEDFLGEDASPEISSAPIATTS
jgi:4-hydroxybenzoyl-CoA thioesterase